MKRILLTLGVAAFTLVAAVAAPAVPGTLASYIALGSGGATIGTTLFSDFQLQLNQAGATQIPTSILVNPINLFGQPALEFVVQQSALAGQLFELKLSYKVQDVSILGAEVGLGAATTASGDGAVTATLDLTGPLPQPATLIAAVIPSTSILSDRTNFPSVAQVLAQTDFVVDGGATGQGGARVFTNRYTVVPEPGTALFGLAIVTVCAGQRRRRQR
jgi:hypothetical protein